MRSEGCVACIFTFLVPMESVEHSVRSVGVANLSFVLSRLPEEICMAKVGESVANGAEHVEGVECFPCIVVAR
jgi:hypothetical protein